MSSAVFLAVCLFVFFRVFSFTYHFGHLFIPRVALQLVSQKFLSLLQTGTGFGKGVDETIAISRHHPPRSTECRQTVFRLFLDL